MLLRSLVLFPLAMALTGCFSELPTYEDSSQIPPFIVVEKTQPPPWVFKRIESNESPAQTFRVVFFSEDLGDPVEALVYVDALPGDSVREAVGKTEEATGRTAPDRITVEDPSTFDVERSVTFEITDFTPGCHAVSALLTHSSNLVDGTFVNKNLVARVVWWLEVHSEFGVEVSDCPVLGVESASDE